MSARPAPADFTDPQAWTVRAVTGASPVPNPWEVVDPSGERVIGFATWDEASEFVHLLCDPDVPWLVGHTRDQFFEAVADRNHDVAFVRGLAGGKRNGAIAVLAQIASGLLAVTEKGGAY